MNYQIRPYLGRSHSKQDNVTQKFHCIGATKTVGTALFQAISKDTNDTQVKGSERTRFIFESEKISTVF